MPSDRTSNQADFLLYERSARQYDRLRFAGMAGRWGHARQVEILRRLADTWAGKRVLEIGCGTGRITAELVRWGANVVATDVSEEMLRVAAARFDGCDPSRIPRFRVMSVFDIDVDLQEYDFVVMINVLGRLSDAGRAIRGIASRLSARGRFIFTFPCLTSVLFPVGLIVNLRGRSLTRDVTSRWYSPRMIEDICGSAGMEIVRFRGNHYVPVPRVLFPTLPFFWACDRTVGKLFPRRCPSVFAECRLAAARDPLVHTVAFPASRGTLSSGSPPQHVANRPDF